MFDSTPNICFQCQTQRQVAKFQRQTLWFQRQNYTVNAKYALALEFGIECQYYVHVMSESQCQHPLGIEFISMPKLALVLLCEHHKLPKLQTLGMPHCLLAGGGRFHGAMLSRHADKTFDHEINLLCSTCNIPFSIGIWHWTCILGSSSTISFSIGIWH